MEDTIDQKDKGGFGGDEVEITYYFQDNGAQDNYYLYSFANPRVAFPEFQAENDENNQGTDTRILCQQRFKTRRYTKHQVLWNLKMIF